MTGGFPVVLHHGLAGSAQVDRPWTQAARAAGVELIAVARPGYGRSSPVDMSCIAEWADVVASVLGTHYGIWAVSAGVPYAYALAAAQPSRVIAVAVTSGFGHADWAVALRESLVHDGAGREAVLQQRPWGFDLKAVCAPVHLWHSSDDPLVPLATAERMREAIPGATMTVRESAEHVPGAEVVAAALSFLGSEMHR